MFTAVISRAQMGDSRGERQQQNVYLLYGDARLAVLCGLCSLHKIAAVLVLST